MKITAYNKFIVALVGLAVTFGVLDTETAQAVGSVLTAAGVLFIPNQG